MNRLNKFTTSEVKDFDSWPNKFTYTYVLLSQKTNQYYTGSTRNLKRRLNEHSQGKSKSTKNLRPLKLIYYEACLNELDARNREKYLKSGWGKRWLKNRLKKFTTSEVKDFDSWPNKS